VAEGTAAEMRDSQQPDVRAFLEGVQDAPLEVPRARTERHHGA